MKYVLIQREARENVKQMVTDGISFRKIRRYLHRYVMWWQKHFNHLGIQGTFPAIY